MPAPQKILFEIGPGWALGADRNQWVIQKWAGKPGKEYWHPYHFIGGTKATLMRVIAENDVPIHNAGWAALQALPETFMEWRKSERPK